jgi:flagellin
MLAGELFRASLASNDNYSPSGFALNSDATSDSIRIPGSLIFSSKNNFTVVGTGTNAFDSTPRNPTVPAVAKLDVSSTVRAQWAIEMADTALLNLNAQRAQLGAATSRFESAISGLQTSSENISASRSRIEDADFAQESAALGKAQILQQSTTAMLAQANQQARQVLSLLLPT